MVGCTTDTFCDCTCTSMRFESVISFNITSHTCRADSPKRIFKISIFRRWEVETPELCDIMQYNIQTHLSFNTIASIADGQQALCQEHLQLLHKEILRVVDADQCTNNITWLVCPELYIEQSSFSAKEAGHRQISCCYPPGPASIGSGSQFGSP